MRLPVGWVNQYLQKPLKPQAMATALEQAGLEVEEITTTSGGAHGDVIDTTTAANRWDLNSLIGVAREAAAHSGQKVSLPQSPPLEPDYTLAASVELDAGTKVADPDLAGRYQLVQLSVDATKPSPVWLQQRLQAIGTRSVNVVVDIANYVMYEYGQPLHAFDAAKVQLPVVVRRAKKGEKLVTLDGTARALDPSDLLITDATGPIGLAGVMGGRNSEVGPATTQIYLESARFNGPTLRRTAARQALRTDASARFERGLPLELGPLALARAVQLLVELASAQLRAGPVDRLQTNPTTTRIAVQPQQISGLLGLELTAGHIAAELGKLGFTTEADATGLIVAVPWWRPDVAQAADIAEEVMKLVGYDRLPATLPAWKPTSISFDRQWPQRWQAQAALRSAGLFEVVTYSFISRDQITALGRDPKHNLQLQNPLSIEQAYLRTDLLPSLLRVAETNRTYAHGFGLFEFSKVYHPTKPGRLPQEPTKLGVMVRIPSRGYQSVKAVLDRLAREFRVEVKLTPGATAATVAHPTRSAQLAVSVGKRERPVGWIAQLHPALVASTKLGGEIGYLELDWERFVAAAQPGTYRAPSRYPVVTRDLSIVVPRKLTWQEIAAKLGGQGYAVSFVNDYYGTDLPAGHKAVAVRVSLSAPDHTLTDAEADAATDRLTAQLKKDFGARLRAA